MNLYTKINFDGLYLTQFSILNIFNIVFEKKQKIGHRLFIATLQPKGDWHFSIP